MTIEYKELEKLKNALPDVQQRIDVRKKRINKVGIRDLIVPIKILDSKGEPQTTVGDVSVYVSLEEKEKGISMSRLPIIVHDVLEKNCVSIHIVDNILNELKTLLKSQDSYVKIKFSYFLKKLAPVSKMEGYIHYPCTLEGKSINNINKIYLTVDVPYTSLCPCSKEISNYSAHNQQSIATITVELNQFLNVDKLIEIVENTSSCPIWSVLKRPDEKYVTERAYEHPQFVEDMSRDISMKLDELLDEEINDYVVVINHFESIHQHKAVAILNAGRKLK